MRNTHLRLSQGRHDFAPVITEEHFGNTDRLRMHDTLLWPLLGGYCRRRRCRYSECRSRRDAVAIAAGGEAPAAPAVDVGVPAAARRDPAHYWHPHPRPWRPCRRLRRRPCHHPWHTCPYTYPPRRCRHLHPSSPLPRRGHVEHRCHGRHPKSRASREFMSSEIYG